ncbi:hypothetical protein F0562_013350 [Nyssa sinensis]|uniref:Uncharacterized protein n=1 Tax=Nyssa sinensis TaxID=561372 RepID=A0A5J4ZMR3_9ASTE|nr:hypothetical protein F0562_013350 [Nyssa sinensis]
MRLKIVCVDVVVVAQNLRVASTGVAMGGGDNVAAVAVQKWETSQQGEIHGEEYMYDTVRFIRQSKKQGSVLIYTLGLMLCEVEIGKWAAESLLELEPQNPAIYISLLSMYSAKGEGQGDSVFSA